MCDDGSTLVSGCVSYVQCRIPGFDYVAAGNSVNKKDAQTNAAKDMVQYLVRVGRMNAVEVPEFMPVCTDYFCYIYRLIKKSYITCIMLSCQIRSN